MIKLVTFGHPKEGVPIYSITMFKTDMHHYIVEISPCDNKGYVVSDPIEWDIFPDWWSARGYVRKKYKEYREYVNKRL